VDEDVRVVCVFVNDKVNAEVIAALAAKGVRIIALRPYQKTIATFIATKQKRT
jgi:hypothetical protein